MNFAIVGSKRLRVKSNRSRFNETTVIRVRGPCLTALHVVGDDESSIRFGGFGNVFLLNYTFNFAKFNADAFRFAPHRRLVLGRVAEMYKQPC